MTWKPAPPTTTATRLRCLLLLLLMLMLRGRKHERRGLTEAWGAGGRGGVRGGVLRVEAADARGHGVRGW
eukprot:741910-Rhodomonas_salina.1